MTIGLSLMVWNELQGCKTDVPELPREEFDEIFAIDGGSTDGTVEYLESQTIPVYRQDKPGINGAFAHAVRKSSSDAIVVFFPKGTMPTEDLLEFRPALESGYDLVVASRFVKGGRNEEDRRAIRTRKWGVCALALFASLVWRREGHFVRDVLHGVKGFTVSAFRQMDLLDHGVSIDLEMVIRSYRLRLKRFEFPTVETPRLYGETHFKILPTGKELLKCLFREMRREH